MREKILSPTSLGAHRTGLQTLTCQVAMAASPVWESLVTFNVELYLDLIYSGGCISQL